MLHSHSHKSRPAWASLFTLCLIVAILITAKSVLRKPFRPEELAAAITVLLEKARLKKRRDRGLPS